MGSKIYREIVSLAAPGVVDGSSFPGTAAGGADIFRNERPSISLMSYRVSLREAIFSAVRPEPAAPNRSVT
jgi:hypothetical protein